MFALIAGVDMQEPWKVLFYHLQSQRGTERRYSYGVSVLHPVHAFMYLTHVLPRWVHFADVGFALLFTTAMRV